MASVLREACPTHSSDYLPAKPGRQPEIFLEVNQSPISIQDGKCRIAFSKDKNAGLLSRPEDVAEQQT